MANIILIEDDHQIAALLSTGLSRDLHGIRHFAEGKPALSFLKDSEIPDLIILDLMLPDMDGMSILEEIRAQGYDVPVMILSAKSSVEEKVLGLKSGADDYLAKPFSLIELTARIEVLLRRKKSESRPTTITIGDVTIDLIQRTVIREGRKIDLHEKEFLLLDLLIRNRNRPVTKKMILTEVYGTTLKAQSNLVDVLVFRLRGKFDKPFAKPYIQTNHGQGFSFEI